MRSKRHKRHITSKWGKTKVLMRSPQICPHIPDTRRMTRHSLLSMLKQYGMVYVKPNRGTFGAGVMRVEAVLRPGSVLFTYQSGLKVKRFSSYNAMYDSLRRLTGKRLYLVQKGIHLLTHRKRRFDIRVMVQQNLKRQWETTGIVGRLAAPKKVVTNIHNGGTVTAVGKLLSGHTAEGRKRRLVKSMRSLGLVVAKRMHRAYPGVKEVGLDVALDRTLYPWILEVNTMPDPYIFTKLKDKSIFRRIARYARAYGRLK
jgi:hypothetical protein